MRHLVPGKSGTECCIEGTQAQRGAMRRAPSIRMVSPLR